MRPSNTTHRARAAAALALFAFGVTFGAGCGPVSEELDAAAGDAAVDAATDVDASVDAGALDAGAARLEIGTGVVAFTPVDEGGDVELISGTQGGWHISIAFRLFELEPDGLLLEIEGTLDGTPVITPVRRTLSRSRVAVEGDHFVRTGDLGVMTIDDPADVVGQLLELRVRATPVSGATVESVKHITIVDLVDEVGS